MQSDFFIGLDLGQTSDPTAVAVLERPAVGRDDGPVYLLRHLQHYPLGTAYTTIVPKVIELCRHTATRGHVSLVVDQTGVGRPVVDMLRRHPQLPRLVPVTITGGQAASVGPDGSRHVPKKDLVASVQLLLEGRRLKIAKGLPDAPILVRELLNFRVTITLAAHETFGAWRENEHDDLVLAVALAAWLAEREPRWGPDMFGVDPTPSILDRLPPGVFQ